MAIAMDAGSTAGPAGRTEPVIVLVEATTEVERDLIGRWAEASGPGGARVLPLDGSALTGPLGGADGAAVVTAARVVWLPREGQLRTALGRAFRRLERIDEGVGAAGWAVVVAIGGRERREIDVDAERAYARSVLALLGA